MVTTMHRNMNRRPNDDRPGNASPFPSTATYFGIAVVFIVLWLLASGARNLLFGSPDPPVPVHAGEPVGSK